MTDVGNNGMFEDSFVTRALDLDGATVEQTGPADPSAAEFPERDVDGSLVGSADAEADEATSRGESI
jgi:hypothetical protein